MSLTGYIDTYYSRTLTGEVDYPALYGPVEADVCVIGGGLAGLNTALGLVERGKSVVLIEAKRISWAASGRNGGFVDKGFAAGEVELAGKVGLEQAQELVALTKSARALIKKRIDEYGIPCGPVIDGVLNVSVHDRPAKVKKYVAEANENFDLGYEYWPREKVREYCKSSRYYDGFFSTQDFQFYPLRYAHGIARALANRGGKVYEYTPAIRISPRVVDWVVHTPEGRVVAKDIVLCCATDVGLIDQRLGNATFPVETYIMVTEPVDEELLEATINTRYAVYEMRFACNYYRRVEGNRILWGGRVALGAHPGNIAANMMHDMCRIYPQLEGKAQPDTAWSGMLCYAPHKMPQIGHFEDGYWFNTAFGGHGLCGTTVGGEVIAAAIAEGDKAFRRFAPFKPYYTGGKLGKYAAEGVYFWWRLRDWLAI